MQTVKVTIIGINGTIEVEDKNVAKVLDAIRVLKEANVVTFLD